MSVPVTTAEFIERLRKSGLFTDARLDHYLKKRPTSADAHAEPIAIEMVRAGLLTDFQANQILSGRHPDFFIAGKYRILELLGRGGMGSVFLCEHVRMRRLVAIKVLPKEFESDPAMLARFEREAQAVAALDHANVVHAYDIDHADGRHFLVMEFIDGIDLQSLVSNHGALSPEQAAWCVAQTARGLHHAWVAGWVHRDIKPGNLLIDRGGCIKILDMGLARIFDAASGTVTSLFNENYILGTADYLSPEQAAGNNETDIRADIYSLGATFYFLLAGKAPFEDGSVSQKLDWHRTLNPLPVRELRPDVPEGMAVVLARMMEKDPRNRYATPGDIAELLMPFCTPAPPPPATTQLPTWSPAVTERIRACQAPSEQAAPQTVPLAVKRAPKTEHTRRIAKPTQLRRTSSYLGKTVVVPRWLVVAGGLLLFASVGWTIYRESHLPVGETQPTASAQSLLQLIPAEEASSYLNQFGCVQMTVGASESKRNVHLYASTTKEPKGFLVLIDKDAIARGKFGPTSPDEVEKLYRNKHIRVIGQILPHEEDHKSQRTGAPYIKIFDPKQIQVLSE